MTLISDRPDGNASLWVTRQHPHTIVTTTVVHPKTAIVQVSLDAEEQCVPDQCMPARAIDQVRYKFHE